MHIDKRFVDGGQAPSVSFVTLGCAKNEVDTAHMRDRLEHAGFGIVDDPDKADAVIVNTCAFLQAATEESIDAVLEAAGLDRISSGQAALIVAGCMPARYGDELAAELTEADAFLPCAEEESVVDVVARALGISLPLAEGQAAGAPERQAGDPSAYVKISDGCDRWCSYCAIPLIRGRYRSFAYEEVEREAARAVERGARELVLIAQDTGRWGTDFDSPSTLAALVDRLASRFPDTWLRVMYIQPEGITDELIEAFARHENVCDYFDVPIQHVSPRVLRRMNRSGSADEFRSFAARIRKRIPDAVLRTTVIAGFPGETDEEFDELVAFIEEGTFDYVGVFPYSREEGTRAATLDGQLDEAEKAERASIVRDIADAVGASRTAERIGEVCDVLVCGREEDGQLFGRTKGQAPEVDGCVYLDAGDVGEIVSAEISGTMFYEMEGEVR